MYKIGDKLMMAQLKGMLLALLFCPAFLVYAEGTLLEDALKCRQVGSKLERLFCFDTVFVTPNIPQGDVIVEVSDPHPKQWKRAFDNEAMRQSQRGFLLNNAFKKALDNHPNIWATAQAIGAIPPRPIMMLSCIDNISRVELIFADPINIRSAPISINTALGESSQDWIVDNSGYILRTGRGLQAIVAMKAMLSGKEFVLGSEHKWIDGLQFDTHQLQTSLKALRRECSW
ncbi:type VI secretion system-associated protein VasI [Shewanella surugensis]|uniref:Type VI secretion system-associated protein TagO n=1 Tax=Shewanella surugensis TaxID=212020 RepID=A0ABT0LCV5_9GAMM|nr:type VI secretion system-associated protein VasI [Shewanella surugensis]MCL1125539.1 type VI secretion system-associated protein TagO [Shewanella surugensis]